MTYVALIRGINVGGKNKISMRELKQAFEQAGMEAVSTYINSGNVLFRSDLISKTDIILLLEKAIKTTFGFAATVVVLSQDSVAAIAKALPDSWVNDAGMKCDVLFLRDEIDDSEIVKRLALKPGIDNVLYVPGALLWSIDRLNLSKSGISKLLGTDLYRQMTIRNCNTLRKLALLVR